MWTARIDLPPRRGVGFKSPNREAIRVHLLPRSVIYFEDFFSSCTSRHTLLYVLCVGREWNIFLVSGRGTKRAT